MVMHVSFHAGVNIIMGCILHVIQH